MKSDTRTVLDVIKTDTAAYTSGILDVGDLHELAVDFVIASAAGGRPKMVEQKNGAYDYVAEYGFCIYRMTAQNTLVEIHTILYTSVDASSLGGVMYPKGIKSLNIGAGLDGVAFGDRIRIDLINDGTVNLAFAISVLGK